MDWTVLGIGPTSNKKEITRAYRAKLIHTNPEDKPEEFKALRAAYEQALSWAASAEATQDAAQDAEGGVDGADQAQARPQTPEEAWLERLKELYNDFPRRIDVGQWRQLLQCDVAVALDTRGAVETMLLLFLMRCNVLPQEVFQLFDDVFKWSERRGELYEKYPRMFVDRVVLDSAKYPSMLPLNLFKPGKNGADCDAYLDLYSQARSCDWEQAPQLFEQMRALSESHPYGQALEYRALVAAGDGLGIVKLLELSRAYPNDRRIKEELAEAYEEGEAWEQCEAVVAPLHEEYPDDRHYTWLLAQAMAGQQRFSEGIDLLGDLMRTAGGDQKELQDLSEVRQTWNKTLIEQYEQRLEQGECTEKLLFELAWCYLQNDRNEESLELIDRMDTSKLGEGENLVEPYEYYNLSSQAYLATKRYEQAFEDSKILVDIVRALKPDGTDRTNKRIARLAEMIARCGDALYAQEKIDQAFPYYHEAMRMAPDSADRLTHYAQVMASLNRWKDAQQAAARLTEVVPNAYHAHYLLAQCYFELHDDRDAFYHVNQALDLEKGDLGVYVLRLRILLRNNALQQAVDDLRFLEDGQCGDYLPVLWCKAIYAEVAGLLQEKEGARSAGPAQDPSGPRDQAPDAGGGCGQAPDADDYLAGDGAHGVDLGTLLDGTPFELESGFEAARGIYQRIYNRLAQGEEMDWPGQACFHLVLLSQEDTSMALDERLDILNKGLELDPRDADCLDLKGWLLARADRTEEAIETYECLRKLPHEGLEPERCLAQLYAKDFAKNPDRALEVYQTLLEHDPNDAVSLYYAGFCAYCLADYAAAQRYFLRERALEPDCPDSYRALALVYETQGRYDDALRECDGLLRATKAAGKLELTPYLRKVQVLRRAGKTRQAVEVLFQASFALPYEEAYADVSSIYMQFGMFKENARHLNSWSNANKKNSTNPRDPGGLAFAQMMQELLGNANTRRAKHFLQAGKPHMSESLRLQGQCTLAAYEGDHAAVSALLARHLANVREKGNEAAHVMAKLALAKWFDKQGEAAVQYAQETLGEIDERDLANGLDRRFYLIRRALMQAIQGNEAAAREDMRQAKSTPLCARCMQAGCPDAVFYEACIDLVLGDEEACWEKVREGRKRWPGEANFACLERELMRWDRG